MKSNLIILSMLVIFTLTTSSLVAGNPTTMHVNIPFAFYVGGQQFAAGDYVFESSSSFASTGASVVVRTKGGKGVCMLNASGRTDKTTHMNSVRFNKYGDKHFLSSVSIQGINTEAAMDKLEKELKAKAEKAEPVTIASK